MSPRLLTLATIFLLIGDAFFFATALALALIVRYGGLPEDVLISLYAIAAPALIALWLFGFAAFGLYDLKLAKNESAFFERLAKALLSNLIITVLLFYLIPEFGLRPAATLGIMFATLAVIFFAWRRGANAVLARRAKERVLFLGITEEAIELSRYLGENPQLGYEPVGYVAGENGTAPGNPGAEPQAPVFAPGTDLAAAIRQRRAELLAIAPAIRRTRALVRQLFGVVPLGVAIVDLNRLYEKVRGKVPPSLISEGWFLEHLIGSKRQHYEFSKRILDLVLATVLGAATLLALPPIAAAIALSTPRDILRYGARRARAGDGVIFFRQRRIGRSGRPFDFIKLRSQVLGAELMGWEKGTGPDPRAYPIGAFLRKTYLDELPQLWNIMKGEMSFVGPRPERPEFVRELEAQIPFYRMRELVLPGITGWAQINMENDASVSDTLEKLQYDLYYIKNRSLVLDLAIMLKTALRMLQRSGR